MKSSGKVCCCPKRPGKTLGEMMPRKCTSGTAVRRAAKTTAASRTFQSNAPHPTATTSTLPVERGREGEREREREGELKPHTTTFSALNPPSRKNKQLEKITKKVLTWNVCCIFSGCNVGINVIYASTCARYPLCVSCCSNPQNDDFMGKVVLSAVRDVT